MRFENRQRRHRKGLEVTAIDAGRPRTRGEVILRTAIEAFGAYGINGASLRDLARQAGTSLTLIHHHYGNKPGLVQASIASLHAAARPHLSVLTAFIHGANELRPSTLVQAWVRFARDAYGHREGRAYLRLMLRLQGDPDVDDATRFGLDASQPSIRQALRRLYPTAANEAFDLAWDASSAAIYASVLGDEFPGLSFSAANRVAALEDYVLGGLDACLGTALADAVTNAEFQLPS